MRNPRHLRGVELYVHVMVAQPAQAADTQGFFNLLTSPELLSVVEDQLPEHRERHYPPTLTLSMFLGQATGHECWRMVAPNTTLDQHVQALFRNQIQQL